MNRYAYLDSSALVKLIKVEPESNALEAYLEPILGKVTSVLGTIEMRRVFRRMESNNYSEEYVWERLDDFSVVEIDNDIARLAGRIGPASLRSLDAIHLATAEYLRPVDPVLVSYDKRLLEAADNLGLRTASPV